MRRSYVWSSALVDQFGRKHNYLRVSLTERCNFRCVYCMPENGVDLSPADSLLTVSEQKQLLRLFSRLGVSKVRFAGGEPLLHPSLTELVRYTRTECGVKDIGVTTNGALLTRLLPSLVECGLNRVNLSIDTLQGDKFIAITRRNGLPAVFKALEMAKEYHHKGKVQLKLNCVVIRGFNCNELIDFALLTEKEDLHVRFIEYMPFSDNRWEKEKVFSFMECIDQIEKGLGKRLHSVADGSAGEGSVAKLFQVEGFRGKIGFITTMTMPFCSTCNRLRLTADGKLMNCLFSKEETNLREILRRGASSTTATVETALEQSILETVKAKKEGLGGQMELACPLKTSAPPPHQENSKGRPMIKIGG